MSDHSGVQRAGRARVRGVVAGAVLLIVAALALSGCTGDPTPGALAPSPVPATTTTPSPTGPTPSEPTSTPAKTTQKVVFGDPWSKDRRRVHAVADSALALINATRKGQTVSLSMFNLTYPTSADTLLRAHRRGVDVRVVVNAEGSRSQQVKRLRATLGTNQKNRSWLAVRGGGIRMHSKFLLVSARGRTPTTVWVSSGNLTNADGSQQANDALVTTGDDELYGFLGKQFDLLRKGVTDPNRLARSATTATAEVQTYPLPAGGRANDPVQALLDDVTCVHGEDRTTVRLAQLFLTDQRLYLTERLRELKAEGCDLRVVGHMAEWDPLAQQALTEPGPGRIDLRSAQGTDLHTKITTIEGWDAAGEPLTVAMVGTHNLTGRALAVTPDGVNDEFSLKIRNPTTVRTYSKWVDMVIRRHSAPA